MKTDNHNARAKLDLRRHFLKRIKPGFSVVDCFAGDEVIWTQLRSEFDVGEYLSIDTKDRPTGLKMDSLRYLENQTWEHDVVDLDAYGSPWRHWSQVVRRRLPCTVFLTIGITVFNKQQVESIRALGIDFPVPPALQGHLAPMIFDAMIGLPFDHQMTVEDCTEALNPGGSARYIGLRLKACSSSGG